MKALKKIPLRIRIVTFLGLCIAGSALAWALPRFHKPALEEYASRVIQQCASSKDHPTCYDQVIPKLMQSLSMKDTFKVTALIQQQDSSYWFCHALGHTLSTKEYEKDPSNWQNVVNECPVGMCSNGCIHGAIQAHFSSSTV